MADNTFTTKDVMHVTCEIIKARVATGQGMKPDYLASFVKETAKAVREAADSDLKQGDAKSPVPSRPKL